MFVIKAVELLMTRYNHQNDHMTSLVPLLLLGLNLVALLLSCLLWNITLSDKSRQADTVVTVRQQPRASRGDTHLDEGGCGNLA